MTSTEVFAVMGLGATVVVNATVVGVAWGSTRNEVRRLRMHLESDGDEGIVLRRELRLVSDATEDRISVVGNELTRVRGVVDAHSTVLATHTAQIATLQENNR